MRVCVCVLVIKVFTDFFDILNGLYEFKRWEMGKSSNNNGQNQFF